MKTYSIEDLLVGQTYYPRSIARKYQFGEINFAEKREDIWLDGYEAYAIRLMKLDEFKAYIEAQRKAQQLTNSEKIAKIVSTTKKGNN